MNASITDPIDQRLEQAHLLMLRGEYDNSRAILVDLNARHPGNRDIERLLAEVIQRGPNRGSSSPAGSLLYRFLSAKHNNLVARAGVSGVLYVVAGLAITLPALAVVLKQGTAATITVQHHDRHLPFAAKSMILGTILLGIAWFRVAHILRSPEVRG